MNHAIDKTKARSRHASKAADSEAVLLPYNVLKSFLITVGIGAASILIAAMVAYFASDPNPLIAPLGLLSAALTATLGGYVTTRIHGHSALLGGLINGCLFTALMLFLSPIAKTHASGYSAFLSAVLHVAFLLLSITGAYLGLQTKPKKRKKRK